MRMKFASNAVRNVTLAAVLEKIDRVYVPQIPGMVRGTVQRELHGPTGHNALADLLDTALDYAEIARLQEALIRLGAKLGVDGDFGEGTKAAIRDFEKAHGLPETGTMNKVTVEAIDEEIDKLDGL
jgi:hypothetical protein